MSKTRDEALQELDSEMADVLKDARAAFEGTYAQELEKLHGLSGEEVDALVPGIDGKVAYSALLDVVKAASAENITSAQLQERVKALGANALAIAKKVGILV